MSQDQDEDELCSEYNDQPLAVIPRKPPAFVTKMLNMDGSTKTTIKAKKSDLVSRLIHLNGERFDFTGRDYIKPVYDARDSQILLKCARQTEKTTFLGNNLILLSVVVPHNRCLYVSPSHSQTRQFSNEKLKSALDQSPLIQKYMIDSSVSSMVFEKSFLNSSYIFLRSCFRTADRSRGISARHLFLDEIQDLQANEIPVIAECTSHFPDATTMMSGTPKTYNNVIETYWQGTTQNEWLVRCTHCNHLNFLDEQNIAPTQLYVEKHLPPGPICKKCQKPIDPTTGKWFTFSPGKNIKGYRISQLMVPWIAGLYSQWIKLLWKRDNYPTGQFQNEVLGLSYDNASKPITRDELIQCCDPTYKFFHDPPLPQEIAHGRNLHLIGGIDWGSGLDGSERSPNGKIQHASYTVLTVGYYLDQKRFQVVFIKKYVGQQADPAFCIPDIIRIFKLLNIQLLGVDWGFGFGLNNELVRALGFKNVVQFQYLPKMKQRQKYDVIGSKYLLQRNLIISETFYALKHKLIIYPSWAEFEPYAKDYMAIFAEYSEFQRQIKYDHKPSEPDDAFHSLVYCIEAARLFHGKRWQT